MASIYPEAQTVWSDILPNCQSWLGADNTHEGLKKLDQRRRINQSGRQPALNVVTEQSSMCSISIQQGYLRRIGFISLLWAISYF